VLLLFYILFLSVINNLIIQYGNTTSHPDSYVTILLPISYTTIYNVVGAGINPTRFGAAIPPAIDYINLNEFKIVVDAIYTNGLRYITIGY